MVAGPYSRTNAQRPDYVDQIRCNWTGHNVDALGVYVCKVNTSEAKHTQLAAQPGVVQLPREYTWDTVISTMQAAARNRIRNFATTIGIDYDTTETIGEFAQRVINSGLWDLGNTVTSVQFQNLTPGQQNKIINLCQKWGLPAPTATETVKQLSSRGGKKWWAGNELYVEEF